MAAIAASTIAADAQATYLVNAHAPVSSLCYKPYKYADSHSEQVVMRGGLAWYGGFTIGHTVAPYSPGYVTFDIGGKYEKLMFVLGHEEPNGLFGKENYTGISMEPGIFAVYADGKKILDEKVYQYWVPKRFTLDIAGVRELKFAVVTGYIEAAVGEATLWKTGQTPVETGNPITSKPEKAELMKDIRSYFTNAYLRPVSPMSKIKSIRINGREYSYGLSASMDRAISGVNAGLACFNLRGQYSKLSFIVGPLDNTENQLGTGWITVRCDGKIIYEEEWHTTDIAQQVTLDVTGCSMLTFHSEQVEGSLSAGIADITVYPEGESPELKDGEDATIDPRLKALPDICRLMSSIPPYAAGSLTKKQLYTGESDYITFSMGGTRFSEGFILYQKASVLSDRTSSYVTFDLGREFDYVSFTAGYIGKSGAMTNDSLFVYADDRLILGAPLTATQPNRNYVLPIGKCRKLHFENKGLGSLDVGAYGIGDIVVYRGEPSGESPFRHPVPDCPDNIELTDLGAPYIHYVSPLEGRQIFCDGSTKKNYWEMDGRRIYKGFLLQTSVHFSLDYGPLSGTGNAAAATIGGAAVGSAFVAGGIAVGGAVVGSTLIGAAAFLMLAAGGEAMENSCAAFNTYGEYNSVTFTVGCYRKRIESLTSGHKETLLIGADGIVVAEIALYEAMEPQTITVPIDGCSQLMFWLANTDNWSGQYLFYDIRLSKSSSELAIPKAAKNNFVITRPEWTAKELVQWSRPEKCGVGEIDNYLFSLSAVYNNLQKFLGYAVPVYEIHTAYLETESGSICKGVSLKDASRSYTHEPSSWLRIPYEYKSCLGQLETLKQIRSEITDLKIRKASAGLALPSLGLGAIAYGKVLKQAGQVLKQCDEIAETAYREKLEETAFLESLVSNASTIDSKESTEKTVLCPVRQDETVDPESVQLLEFFYLK